MPFFKTGGCPDYITPDEVLDKAALLLLNLNCNTANVGDGGVVGLESPIVTIEASFSSPGVLNEMRINDAEDTEECSVTKQKNFLFSPRASGIALPQTFLSHEY